MVPEFWWCDGPNLPILGGRCPDGAPPRPIRATRPLNLRPPGKWELELLGSLLSRYGQGCSGVLDGLLLLLNRVPHTDRMEEIVVDGRAIGRFFFVPGRGFVLRPGAELAALLSRCAERLWVRADEGASRAILEGKNLMGPGVLEADPGIEPGDEVLVLGDGLVASGTAARPGGEMAGSRGMAVRIRHVGDGSWRSSRQPSWEEVLKANREAILDAERRAVEGLLEVVRRFRREVAVSFSGGKDSTAAALIALEAGLRPKLVFVDTGLEFPETVEYVREFAERHGLELLVEDAGDAFWRRLPLFGPPGRDYRWCCKVLKLGPTVRLILREFPRGVLMLVAQRATESPTRRRTGRLWRNPWVPRQISFSPVQEWPTLLVHLYLMLKGEPLNPWYDRGLDRIGCYLCPSQDLGDWETVRQGAPELAERWESWLRSYASREGLPPEWIELGGWRWARPPRWVPPRARVVRRRRHLRFRYSGGRLTFSRKIDLGRASNALRMLGSVEEREGMLKIKGLVEAEVGEYWAEVRSGDWRLLAEAIGRSEDCVGCGICLGRCPYGALELVGDRIKVKESCIGCGACLRGPCPATRF